MNLFLDEDFLDSMADCFCKGSTKDGRAYFDWKRLKWNPDLKLLYTSKLIGHMANGIRANTAKERREHLAAVACNANILWHHEKDFENDKDERKTT